MVRATYPLNRNWRYHPASPPGFAAPDFDDSGWTRVTVPHTNRRFPWHSFDDRDYQFRSAYRRRIAVPELRGRRVFVHFDAVMTAATVWCDGIRVGEHLGGFTPFTMELTDHVRPGADNVLAVEVDSTERPDIPPFGGRVDYLTFGGIYRDVSLSLVPETFLADVFAAPLDVLGDDRSVRVRCVLDGPRREPLRLEARLLDGESVLASTSADIDGDAVELSLAGFGDVRLWELDRPELYRVLVRVHSGDSGAAVLDERTVRIGFRDARFTTGGFFLNGRRIALRGLNRHQTYPFVGAAMPERVQRRDAEILKRELHCNIVRTSHYPQSPHFLDACDELGLLVLEEIPGWQHIGDKAWQELSYRDVEAMVCRDRNRPSVVLWGVRINESGDDHDFYTETNRIAHELDDTRQTCGVRFFADSEPLEDVFTINDFRVPELMLPPSQPRYLVTEFAGHTLPTKAYDHGERLRDHLLRHAGVHNVLGSDPRYAGGIGWCAFDYNTHADFGSGDRVCYHGVSDIFRIGKPAAAFYRAQCDPGEEIVLEPAFSWSREFVWSADGVSMVVASNCDMLRCYLGNRMVAEARPDRENHPNLPHPPFLVRIAGLWGAEFGDLRIDGYLGGELVATRRLSGSGVDAQFVVRADDTELAGDGRDATRVVLAVTDEYGNHRPQATGAVTLRVAGPGELLGENPFALTAGVGAVWLRAAEASGTARLHATHPVLGERVVEVAVRPVPEEEV